MAKMKWGTKRICLGCGKKFYDMQRDPIVCPSCDTPFEVKTSMRSQRQRSARAAKPVASLPDVSANTEKGMDASDDGHDLAAVEDESTENSSMIGEEADEAIEDPSELGQDDDEITEVIEDVEMSDKTDA